MASNGDNDDFDDQDMDDITVPPLPPLNNPNPPPNPMTAAYYFPQIQLPPLPVMSDEEEEDEDEDEETPKTSFQPLQTAQIPFLLPPPAQVHQAAPNTNFQTLHGLHPSQISFFPPPPPAPAHQALLNTTLPPLPPPPAQVHQAGPTIILPPFPPPPAPPQQAAPTTILPPFTGPILPPNPHLLASQNPHNTLANPTAFYAAQEDAEARLEAAQAMSGSFAGLGIEGLSAPPTSSVEREDVEMGEAAEEKGGWQGFGDGEEGRRELPEEWRDGVEDYSEDEEWEYDEEVGDGERKGAAEGRTAKAPGEDAQEQVEEPQFLDLDRIETADQEVIDDDADSDWEDDPTGYSDAEALKSMHAPAPPPTQQPSPLDALGIHADPTVLAKSLKRSFSATDPDLLLPTLSNPNLPWPKRRRTTAPFPFFESLATYPELYLELCKHLRIADLLSLYAIQRDFHETVNGHLAHAMKSCARHHAPESSAVFAHAMYQTLCVSDPARRPDPRNWAVARRVPGLRWLQMVCHRERVVRDILAALAREGHRTPRGMALTLKKVWVVMDVATTAQRICLVHNEAWFTDQDCYNAQLFVMKLNMRFNEPLTGVGDDGLTRVMLGQRGLTPLCRLLKREAYFHEKDILRLAIRYCYEAKPQHKQFNIFGIRARDVGRGHLEGWGLGKIHLFRIDELVMRESVRRRLNLDDHLLYMMLWGHVDPVTKEDIKATDEELYMSDTEDEERKWVARQKALKQRKREAKQARRAGNADDDDDDDDTTSSSDSSKESSDEWEGIEMDPATVWETDDEDLPMESLFNDVRDSGAIGPSGWRRPREFGVEVDGGDEEDEDEDEEYDDGDDWSGDEGDDEEDEDEEGEEDVDMDG